MTLTKEADVADDEEPPKEDEPEGVVEIEAPAPAPAPAGVVEIEAPAPAPAPAPALAPALGGRELLMAERLMGLRLMYGTYMVRQSTTG